MKKKMLCIVLSAASIHSFGQGADVPWGNEAYPIIERLEIKSGLPLDIHTAHKPYSRQDIAKYAVTMDTASVFISAKDRKDLYYIYKDNSAHLAPKTSESANSDLYIESKKPILKYFYKTPANLYEANVPHFSFNVNPLLDIQAGREIGLNGTNENRTVYNNMRGIGVQAAIDDKVYFFSNIYENQTRFTDYVNDQITRTTAVPGATYYKSFDSRVLKKYTDDYDYLNVEGAVGVRATKHIRAQLGHGRNFIGDGYRSLFLSDFGSNYFYLKLNTRVWKFDYQNLFAELTGDFRFSRSVDNVFPKKYLAMHRLSFRPNKNLTMGIMEGVMFSRKGRFELQYLNPVIFYRTVEQMVGSPDNAVIGLDFKYNFLHRFSLYGQFLLDEFVLSNVMKQNGWWANKYAAQLGLKYINVAGIDHLDAQVEYNVVRPYTYTFRDTTGNFTHFNQPLAHPLGANFSELVGAIRYQPIPKLIFQGRAILATVGKDSSNTNYGQNLLLPYTTREKDFGNEIGQGATSRITTLHLNTSFQVKHNLYLDFTINHRKELNNLQRYANTSNYVGLGLRWNVGRRNWDF